MGFMNLARVTLVGGQILKVHPRSTCRGYWCCIHYPSNHHMREWPQNWREDRAIMERVCEHGIGHPDPDDPSAFRDGVHGCDGCCARPFEIDIDEELV